MDFSEQTGEIGSFRMFRLIKIQSFNVPSDSRMNLQQTEINQRHNKFPIAMVETHTHTQAHWSIVHINFIGFSMVSIGLVGPSFWEAFIINIRCSMRR